MRDFSLLFFYLLLGRVTMWLRLNLGLVFFCIPECVPLLGVVAIGVAQ